VGAFAIFDRFPAFGRSSRLSESIASAMKIRILGYDEAGKEANEAKETNETNTNAAYNQPKVRRVDNYMLVGSTPPTLILLGMVGC